MLINKSIREAVADVVRAAQPLFLLVNDSFPAGFDASRELPAAAVWFEDGAPDDAYVDADTQSTELQIGIYVKTDGILVLGTAKIADAWGNECSPAQNLVQSGDYIVSVTGRRCAGKRS